MTSLVAIGAWVTENESLLSGLAAMIVLFGVVLSPLGVALRRLVRRGPAPKGGEVAGESGFGRSPAPVGPAVPTRITLKAMTAPSSHPTRFAQSDGARIAYNERGAGPIAMIVAPGILSHLNVMDALPATRGTLDALPGA